MEPRKFANIRIGDVLQELGYATDEQISEALAYQKANKGIRMGDALIKLGFITEKQMLKALADRLNYKMINISDINVEVSAVAKVPKTLAEQYCMMGYAEDDNMYYLLVNDPMNFYGIEDIRQIVGKEIEIALCEKSALENSISYYYSEVTAKEAASRAADGSNYQEVVELDLDNAEDDTPIINLFNNLIIHAYNSNV